MSWRTRTRLYNSKSGTGCIIGHNTGKFIDFPTRNKDCRYCDLALRNGREPKKCFFHHSGSSKLMESEVCQDLFSKGDYKVTIADEDGTSEAKVKSNVNADIEKWSDKNHVVRILGKMLYDAKKMDFGSDNDRINDAVIDYISVLCFLLLFQSTEVTQKACKTPFFLLFHMNLEITVGAEHGVDSKKTQKRTSTSISLVEKISLEMASGLF